ncbi:hypothetical protein KI387_013298, partial [Taxus chinensis]
HHDKLVNFVCGELSKKRKLEEQLNFPSSKYKFKTKLGSPERECPFLDACSDDDDSSRSLDCVMLPGTDGTVSEVTIVNGSTVVASNVGKLDTNADLKTSDNGGYSAARENGDGNVMLPSFISCAKSRKSSLQLSLVPADDRLVSCSTGHSCISESSKHIYCETSCSYSQVCRLPVNQSRNAHGNQPCSSPDSLTTFVGLELSEHSMHYVGRKATKKRTPVDIDCLPVNLQFCTCKEENLYTDQSYLEHNQFNRFLTSDGTSQAEENNVHLLATDGAETDSVDSIVSTYKPANAKRHKSVNTPSCTWEFGSGSAMGSHIRAEFLLVTSGDTNSFVGTGNCQNSLIYDPQSISCPYNRIDASITPTETYEELDASNEPYSERQALSTEIMADTSETLPLYVLSSGRASHKE